MSSEEDRFGSTRQSGTTYSGPRRATEQWFRALFAYRELYGDPRLEVRQDLEDLRTVPARRWDSHRALLKAVQLLSTGLDVEQLGRERALARRLITNKVAAHEVRELLGEFGSLTSDALLQGCPVRAYPGINTFWSDGSDEAPVSGTQVALSLELGEIRCPTLATARGGIVLAAYCPADVLTRSASHIDAYDLMYVARQINLVSTSRRREFSVAEPELVDHLHLTGCRAAWAVGLQLFDATVPEFQASRGLFRAAVGAAQSLAQGLGYRVSIDSGDLSQAFVMDVADVARLIVSLTVELVVCLARAASNDTHRVASTHLFDSKYFYAVSQEALERRVPCVRDGYEASLVVRPSGSGRHPHPATSPLTGPLMRMS